jgi:hypothetical protein
MMVQALVARADRLTLRTLKTLEPVAQVARPIRSALRALAATLAERFSPVQVAAAAQVKTRAAKVRLALPAHHPPMALLVAPVELVEKAGSRLPVLAKAAQAMALVVVVA